MVVMLTVSAARAIGSAARHASPERRIGRSVRA
jgi:hypothetical protein